MKYGQMISDYLSGAYQRAGDVAENIAGSDSFKKYFKRIVPDSADFSKEAVAAFTKMESTKMAAASTATSMSGISDEVKTAISKVRSKADIEKLAETYSLDSATVNSVKRRFSDSLSDLTDTVNYGRRYGELNPLDKAKVSTIAYFTNPDEDIRKTRIAGAIGAYGIAAGGLRVMSGGSLTSDQYGRKDIAGIPFI